MCSTAKLLKEAALSSSGPPGRSWCCAPGSPARWAGLGWASRCPGLVADCSHGLNLDSAQAAKGGTSQASSPICIVAGAQSWVSSIVPGGRKGQFRMDLNFSA